MMNDLRDTDGSWLPTVGIPIQNASREPGRNTIAVTEKRYPYLGRGGDGSRYVEPPKRERGEVPADLLARLGDGSQSAHAGDSYALLASLQVPELATDFADPRFRARSAERIA